MEVSEKIPISVVIIAYNEELMISDCLNSVNSFDDVVIIIDSKTTDGTVQIAKDFGCRVFIEDWQGDGYQKQKGIDKSIHDWVLILDADERIAPVELIKIKDAVKLQKVVAFSLKRRSYIGNRRIKHSGWWPDRVIRLFNKNNCAITGVVHAEVQVSGNVMPLDVTIEHFSYRDYSHMIEKLNTYSSWGASVLHGRNKNVNSLTPIVHGAWMFFRTLVIKRGFVDGLDGLVISLSTAVGSFFKYAKLLERQREKKH